MGKIHIPNLDRKKRQISSHVRPWPTLGPTYKENKNFYRESGHVSASQMGRPTAYKKPLRGNYRRFGEKSVLWEPRTENNVFIEFYNSLLVGIFVTNPLNIFSLLMNNSIYRR